jgi:hypothetical protein
MQTWESQEIADCHIVMSFYEAFAVGLKTQREVTVRNGQITESSCLADECPAFVLVDVYTVEDLFAVAQGSSLPRVAPDELDECIKSIEFDAVYGFPVSMSFDCPSMLDEEHSVRVESFEVVK